MSFSQRLVVLIARATTRVLFNVDAEQLQRVPQQGPLIIITNHVNIMEIPVLYSRLQPRPLIGMVLATRWKNPFLKWGLNASGAIPLERGGINMDGLRKGVEVLKEGKFIILNPEGTRSGHGRLQKGNPGVIPLALKSGAPLLPIVYYGGEKYKENLKRLRRTDLHIAVGKPFTLAVEDATLSREVRQQITDEIMYQLAALLPPEYRGKYADLSQATQRYLAYT